MKASPASLHAHNAPFFVAVEELRRGYHEKFFLFYAYEPQSKFLQGDYVRDYIGHCYRAYSGGY